MRPYDAGVRLPAGIAEFNKARLRDPFKLEETLFFDWLSKRLTSRH